MKYLISLITILGVLSCSAMAKSYEPVPSNVKLPEKLSNKFA